jgi:DNA invertase Pin-like site-specific DNA recombinase
LTLATAAGNCFLDMLAVFAEFETNLRRERQLEGIANAKAAGVRSNGLDRRRPGARNGGTGARRIGDREGP